MHSIVLVTLLLAAVPGPNVPPLVTGGTQAQNDVVQAAVDKVPECLRECDGKKVTVVILEDVPGSAHTGINAFYGSNGVGSEVMKEDGTTVPIKLANGLPLPTRAQNGRVIAILPGQIPGATQTAYLDEYEKSMCGNKKAFRAWSGNLDSTLVHEYAHHFQFSGCKQKGKKTNKALVNEFLAVKYAKTSAAVKNDRKLAALNIKYMEALSAASTPATPKEAAALCRIQEDISVRKTALGLPERFVGDTHAEESEDEYFAVAVETMTSYPDRFCAAFSTAERAWLASNLSCVKPKDGSCPQDPKGGKRGQSNSHGSSYLRP